MVVDFQTQPAGNKTHRNAQQFVEAECNMESWADYLKDKYEYISKMDMLRDEKEARQYYKVTVSQAISVWNKIYGQ